VVCPLVQSGTERLSCPACGALMSHRSRRRGVIDRIISSIGGQTRRCDVCTTRFVRFGSSTILSKDLSKAHQKVFALVLKTILFFAGIFGGPGFATWVWSRIP
jgi:hypothetical protein